MSTDQAFDVLYFFTRDIVRAHWHLILNVFVLLVLWRGAMLFASVWRKQRLIRSALQQAADEISRLEYITIDSDIEHKQKVAERFQVTGLTTVRGAARNSLLSFDSSDDKDMAKLAEAVDSVWKYTADEYRVFTRRRRLMRHMLDGLDALVGDHKSTETAWASGLVYLEKYCTYVEKDTADMPWIQSYVKVVGLPHNIWAAGFTDSLQVANSRMFPPGLFSLWLACHTRNYIKRLRYGTMIRRSDEKKSTFWIEKRGPEAWELLLTFKSWHYQRVELMTMTPP